MGWWLLSVFVAASVGATVGFFTREILGAGR
jgi:hypothetical protein